MIIIILNILISVGKCLRAKRRRQRKESSGLMDDQIDKRACRPTDAGMGRSFLKYVSISLLALTETHMAWKCLFWSIYSCSISKHVVRFFTDYRPSFGQKYSLVMSNSPEFSCWPLKYTTLLCSWKTDVLQIQRTWLRHYNEKATELRLCSGYPVIWFSKKWNQHAQYERLF